MRFHEKVTIITGAASGMGLVASRCMAQEGAIVYMVDINAERVKQEADAICENGGKAAACVCNVREFAQIQSVVDRCIAEQGRIDIIINFAGGFPPRMCKEPDGLFIHESIETIDWGIDVNFRAPMLFARAAMEQMMNQKSGVIILIGSVDGETGGGVDYAAEKAGLTYGLTKALARIGAPYGVRCCAVSPGPVLTRAAMSEMPTALGRAAEPIEIVKLVMYLCSEDAAFITGTNYNIEGGRLLLNNQ